MDGSACSGQRCATTSRDCLRRPSPWKAPAPPESDLPSTRSPGDRHVAYSRGHVLQARQGAPAGGQVPGDEQALKEGRDAGDARDDRLLRRAVLDAGRRDGSRECGRVRAPDAGTGQNSEDIKRWKNSCKAITTWWSMGDARSTRSRAEDVK